MTTPLLTWLYSPASRRDRILKALDYTADAVIYDLEDGVAPPEKAQARRNLAEALEALDTNRPLPQLEVRINGVGSEHFEADLDAVRALHAISSVRVPKVESAGDVDTVVRLLRPGMRVNALIETAIGVENLREICESPHVAGVSLGEADLRAQLRLSGMQTMESIRSRLVISSAAAGKHAPMGSAYLNIHDHEGLLADTKALASEGFVGRTALHPAQLPHIRAAFSPSREEYERALTIIEATGADDAGSGSGASALTDGTFIDRPVITRALQTIAMWQSAQHEEGTR
ncbi:citrate lyase subunit beta/citryl-CoA lyase [Homoserinimonas aerilata]|uniref:Citrate lyase subunit beta/citryl-CoA lyase n=1 Tax=Homoserinimonas aerilata TaxID=1162970 RepID=A0A542YA87_9MICO|nr:CoA ester lyase [Homoserinimonas aerilata]TQL45026.1 citrate lyase subunit beta/citryl-CoA lyase [Homoserinimonas aerilata]